MATALLKNRRLSLLLLLRQTGWPILSSLILLSLAALIHAQLIPAWQQRHQASMEQLSHNRQQASAADPRPLLNQRYLDFIARLASSNEQRAVLESLFTAAQDHGLSLSQADYQWQNDEDGGFQRWQISLPLKGNYAKIRAFIDTTLIALPAASLDEMSFQRPSVKNPLIEARLKFTVLMKEGE